MDSPTFSDFIIWTSPAAFALAIYLAHDAFSSVKDEIKTMREKQNSMREELVEIKSTARSAADGAHLGINAMNVQQDAIKRVEIKLESIESFTKTIEKKISDHDENYGKVILILKKVVATLKPKNPQDRQE